MSKVLVIIVSYNAMLWVDKCLGSIRNSRLKLDAIIVDNGSTDGTQEHIRSCFPEFTLVQAEKNLGFGAANNIAMKFALDNGYDYVYLLNQDAWITPDTIGRMIELWPKGFGILSPVQRDKHGNLDRNFARHCAKYINSSHNEVDEVPFVMAAHWLISTETVKRVGGFSPAFKHYGEDDNYIHRLHYHGLKAGVVNNAAGVHDRTSRNTPKEKRMRLKCVSTIVKLSDPNSLWIWRSIREPLELIGMSVKNFSLIPIRFIPELLRRRGELKVLREISMKEGSFLDQTADLI